MPPKGSKKNVAMKKPAAASPKARKIEADIDEETAEQDAVVASAEAPAPIGAASPPSVSVEYVGGQRVYTAWVQIEGTSRRVLAPPRPVHDRAAMDFALVKSLAEKPWAGEAIAGKWRRGEIDDKQAAQELKAAPSEAPAAGVAGRSRGRGRGGRGRGRGGGAPADDEEAVAGEEAEGAEEEEEAASPSVLKKPAAAKGKGRGRGRGRGAPVLKRPAGSAEDTPSRKKRELGDEGTSADMAGWGGA